MAHDSWPHESWIFIATLKILIACVLSESNFGKCVSKTGPIARNRKTHGTHQYKKL